MNDQIDPLAEIEKLCDLTSLHINCYSRNGHSNPDDNAIVVTISNNAPTIIVNDKEEKKVSWQKSDIAVDLCVMYSADMGAIDQADYIVNWIKTIATILTFKGHEVFVDGELFRPYK